MLEQIRTFIAYVCWPPYRRKIDAELGWHKVFHALVHMAAQETTFDNLATCWVLRQKMRELASLGF